jgi:hypothetical protein
MLFFPLEGFVEMPLKMSVPYIHLYLQHLALKISVSYTHFYSEHEAWKVLVSYTYLLHPFNEVRSVIERFLLAKSVRNMKERHPPPTRPLLSYFLFPAWTLHDSPENTASEKNVNILVDAISTEI